ncbi:alpha/beta fold hydrolase [Nocardia crassostreae]|uniref:alpha/beta fold hydrolase n=1 Tax=Nocardia crassostreae TaxID=53428 RepID=UPI00147212CA|nr:alpha/beta hydrolase [Nocardia crassostreae]
MTTPTPWTTSWHDATVGGMECGDREGFPVLAFHGAPGSHMEAVVFAHAPAAEVGVRLIAIDRPGIGRSEMSLRRRVADFADTVAAVADHFHLDRFAVLGASGGGPYAMACAAALPDRITEAVLVSSPAAFDEQSVTEGSGGVKRAGGLMVLRRFPFLARPVAARLGAVVRTPRGLDAMIERMSPADRDRIARDDRLKDTIAENIRAAFESGSHSVAVDFQLLFARPWGFDPADITVPVHIWHGAADGNVPVEDGRRLAATIPDSKFDEVQGAGHLLFVDHAAEILSGIGSR